MIAAADAGAAGSWDIRPELASAVDVDGLLLLTDVDAVIDGFGTPSARPIHHTTPGELRARSFPAGSMGPKVDPVCRFVEATGRMAIGSLGEAETLLRREAGTAILPSGPRGNPSAAAW